MTEKLSGRAGSAAGAAVCAALLGFGYYLQYARGLEPCPLCHVQRGFFYAVMAVFLVGAARQVWLQHLPADKVPQCGPDLFFMLENFPLGTTLQKLIQGTGECAQVDWTFLGMSIAEWSLVWFVVLALYALWLG